MADDVAAQVEALNATLSQKYRAFLEGLSDEELALYGASLDPESEDVEVQGFWFGMSFGGFTAQPALKSVMQDVTVNKAKTADKAFKAMDGYIRG